MQLAGDLLRKALSHGDEQGVVQVRAHHLPGQLMDERDLRADDRHPAPGTP